jgi:formylglycine-generating enzyme required for sulfatase activity
VIKPLCALALIPLLVSACALSTPGQVAGNPLPTIELISPPSGVRVILGEELEIETRSSDERGLERIELWVDESIYRVDQASGQASFHVIQRWRADKPGQHELRVQAIDVDGQISQPARFVVEVIDPALFTATPTGTPVPTPVPTDTPTNTPAPTATATPEKQEVTATPALTPMPTEPTSTPTPPSSAEMILIPGGTFLMGSTQEGVQQAASWCGCDPSRFEDELYMHEVYVSSFYIEKYEVTNEQFMAFVEATGYETDAEKKPEAHTWRTEFTPGKENHPVVWMSWNDANAYCAWAGKRLPTEAEWEKAARGTDGRLWPWGNDWDNSRLNMGETRRKTTTEAGSFPNGASPYGVMDMAGNVWEWVNDWYGSTYYQQGKDRDPMGPESGEDRVLRGGAFNNGIQDVRTANRHKGGMAGYAPDHGFRCAK